ncbi:DASH complex, subunit Dad3 [Ascodesmis nigricans]|uniref:DASH complex subunit DAD3 n=1 Tax=Ascodesmis nigricans TaxID=341454 RepID=A0A4S2MPY4_9PEZI|nr:DASH complex, subunit Dad3 [Ascodesmis nigricans]
MSTSPPDYHHHPELLTPLEQGILDEYHKLLLNLQSISSGIAKLADAPVADIMESLRALERKSGLVFTLLKASVYKMVLMHQLNEEGAEGETMD